MVLDGHADFLAEPHLGIKANVALEGIALDYFKPITNRYNVTVRKGVLSANGLVEYAPAMKVLDLESAAVRDLQVEYTHTPAKKGVVQEATTKTAQKAREVSNEPGILLRAKELKVTHSTVGFVNKAVTPPYRAFLSDTNLTISNFSNQLVDGSTVARLTGKFMGSGTTVAVATFRPDKKGPDFDLALRLENTDMKTMNDILRAYGSFDVTAGTFSLFSEIKVKNQRMDGYVKPLFSDLDIYNPEQDREKSVGRETLREGRRGRLEDSQECAAPGGGDCCHHLGAGGKREREHRGGHCQAHPERFLQGDPAGARPRGARPRRPCPRQVIVATGPRRRWLPPPRAGQTQGASRPGLEGAPRSNNNDVNGRIRRRRPDTRLARRASETR